MDSGFGTPTPLASSTPQPEATAARAGQMESASRGDHQHPRLTSSTGHVLDVNGEAVIVFTRPFAPFAATPDTPWPAIDCFYTEAADKPPIQFKAKSWQTDAGGNFIGCTVKGYRGQVLPSQNQVNLASLLSALISGVNALAASLTGFNTFGGSAAGIPFTCIAVARSSPPA